MKTAKELLELRNKLEEEYEKEKKEIVDKAISKEWKYIEDTIDKFKVARGNSYIEINKVKYKANRNKLKEYGFFALDGINATKLYFDENEFTQDIIRRKAIKNNSVNVKSDSKKYPWQDGIYKLESDPNSPPITVKWHNHKGDYDRLLEKINECFKFY